MPKTRLALVTLGATALLAVGCGQSRDSSPKSAANGPANATSTASVSHSTGEGHALDHTTIVAKANAICKRTNARRRLIKTKTEMELELALPQLVSYQQTMTEGLRELTPPASMASDWNQMIAYSQTIARMLSELYDGARANARPGSGQPLWETYAKSIEGLQAIARRDGIVECSHA